MTGGLTFAVADLHGRYDLLLAALGRIEARAAGGKVVFLGDYVDRGPQSRAVVERLMSGPTQPGWAWICLMGNHEAMMSAAARRRLPLGDWLDNGGGATLLSYGQATDDVADPGVVPEDHIDWMEARPLLHADAHRVYVHAAVDRSRSLASQDPEILLWHRYARGDRGGHGGRHVVHGHHPFVDGPHTIGDRTDLDTLAWKTGRLVVGVFEDRLAGGPVELMEIAGPPAA